MPRPQFRLRSLFVLTAIVAVGGWLDRRHGNSASQFFFRHHHPYFRLYYTSF
ncbi:MAG TPA: hypothetical protein VND64_11600 [Pirellulales bacterium]|nr:hypothetical protein [Pirellulales bacterium]